MTLSRRRLIGLLAGLAAVAGNGLLARRGLAEGSTRQVYFLDPEWGAGLEECPAPHLDGSGCHACRVCHAHSVKAFTSASLAGARRAHPRCKCIVRSRPVPNREYVGLFGPMAGPLHRDEFDPRRDRLFPAPKGGAAKPGEEAA